MTLEAMDRTVRTTVGAYALTDARSITVHLYGNGILWMLESSRTHVECARLINGQLTIGSRESLTQLITGGAQ